MHVKTDVFCAATVILPDKAGRLIDVGGWSLDSTFGIRLYTPSGSAGVNGTTDWEENVNELSLQVRCLGTSVQGTLTNTLQEWPLVSRCHDHG